MVWPNLQVKQPDGHPSGWVRTGSGRPPPWQQPGLVRAHGGRWTPGTFARRLASGYSPQHVRGA